jgi:hypothetical protein
MEGIAEAMNHRSWGWPACGKSGYCPWGVSSRRCRAMTVEGRDRGRHVSWLALGGPGIRGRGHSVC